jgi:hypothetical protein
MFVIWWVMSLWVDSSRNYLMRKSLPGIYTEFRSGQVPQQRPLARVLWWGAVVWMLASITSCVV